MISTPVKIKATQLPTDKVCGVSNPPPIILASALWGQYKPSYEPQRFVYDTNECSQLGGFINPLETFFNMLEATGQLSPEFIAFGNQNGYKDANGSWSFSERYIAILDGTSINGNDMRTGYEFFPTVGVIPRSMLNWTLADAAKYPNQALMDTNYYDESVITPEMRALGQQFLSYIKEFAWGWIAANNGPVSLHTLAQGLQTSPLGIAIPIPQMVQEWNQSEVSYDGSTEIAHCVELYGIGTATTSPSFNLQILDQYQPWEKALETSPNLYDVPCAIAFFVVMV